MAESKTLAASIPPVRLLDRPLVVLVLDLSGSMQQNDPQCLQAEAVSACLEVYGTMVRDALRPGQAPRLAIVVFSTAATVLRWPEAQGSGTILEMPPNTAALSALVDKQLGSLIRKHNNRDPRVGSFTDYFAALREVEAVLAEAGTECSPPCVVFMTDGQDNPFGPFMIDDAKARETAVLGFALNVARQVTNAYPARATDWTNMVTAVSNLVQFGRVSGSDGRTGRDPVAAFATSLGPGGSGFLIRRHAEDYPPTLALRRQQGDRLNQCVARLDALRFGLRGEDSVPLLCEFVYLGSAEPKQGPLHDLSRRFVESSRSWQAAGSNVLLCELPEQMASSFIRILGRWLGLDELPLKAAEPAFTVDPKTMGLGVLVEAAASAGSPVLVNPQGQKTPLQAGPSNGNGVTSFLTLSNPLPGTWRIEAESGIRDARVWLKRRYAWAFDGLPTSYSPLTRPPAIRLGLYDSVTGKEVHLDSLYDRSSLPLRVEGVFRSSGGTTWPVPFMLSQGAWSNGYTAPLPSIDRATAGQAQLSATLAGLRATGSRSPLPSVRVESAMQLNVVFDFQLRNADGSPSGGISFERTMRGMGALN